MPAQRLENAPVNVRLFDIAAQDSPDVACFVRHIGLANEPRTDFQPNDKIPLLHMGPPLEVQSNDCHVHAFGSLPLTIDEIRAIRLRWGELEEECRSQSLRRRMREQYVIVPHATPWIEKDGTVISTRFNCAGFVVEMYEEAGIAILVCDAQKLPLVSLETLLKAYPDQAKHLQREQTRKEYGLKEAGPWPVVMAGYVLNRDEYAIRSTPYQAQPGDEFFPPRAPTAHAGRVGS